MSTVSSSLRTYQLDSEKYFVACIFADSSGFYIEQVSWLSPDFFIDEVLRDYWSSVRSGSNPIEIANRMGLIHELSGYVLQVPSTLEVKTYANAIVEGYYLRSVYNRLSGLVSHLGNRDIGGVRSVLSEMSEINILNIDSREVSGVHERFSALLRKIERGDSRVVKTFLPQLDGMLGGFFDELVIFAARPGVGKTQLSWQIAQNVAEHGNMKVLFFSLEMSETQLWARFACPLAGYEWKDVRANNVPKDAYKEIDKASSSLRDRLGNLSIIDDAYSVHEIHQHCIAERPDFVIIDQLPELHWHNPEESMVIWYGKAAKYIRDYICRKICPTILVHQLNRASEARQDHRPQASDLRQSGELEQRADVVLLAHREDMYDKINYQQKLFRVPFEIWSPKNRFGSSSGVAILEYDLKKQWFT